MTVLTLGHGTTLFVKEPLSEVLRLMQQALGDSAFIRLTTAKTSGTCCVRVSAIVELWEPEK